MEVSFTMIKQQKNGMLKNGPMDGILAKHTKQLMKIKYILEQTLGLIM